MDQVFIIGLPNQIRRRLEAALEDYDISPTTIPADIDRSGRLKLLPDPSVAASRLQQYCETVEGGYDHAEVYVLPYTFLPEDLSEELSALAGMGAEIVYFAMEEDGWPYMHHPKPKITEKFLDAIFHLLLAEIAGEIKDDSVETILPSQYIRQACQCTPNLIVVGGAIDLCDAVAPGRYPWVKLAVDALAELADKKGNVGVLDAFFTERRLYHAKSGGITIQLDIKLGEKHVVSETSNEHLKKGDATTPQAAVRVYYQLRSLGGVIYVFLLYIGPHPEKDLHYAYQLP
ncbi:hypothetical protein ACT5AY_001480 [Pseudomonas aeruginosa]|uniref:hypothetical protein n=1 Tax=Pseudomonas aeruginosa group TaxID=136841 RepID=UPI00071B03F6|nr:hypothetical protein [Pseudomonas paraeruginosa]KSP90997.1 hypothetical protein APB27_12570 [Pseudomonas aeruginosa]MBG5165529.1 hypothetical protein [Pseudomonas aeruginosa]MBH3771488.1 hypothetical protein [Pseudomonas aeruginosa]RTT26690.1 hypothetical protein DY956_30220 [Pseudomonas paraeruginosa]HEK1481315.1 hypothetical protein [Pseudomonas aeruginosa]